MNINLALADDALPAWQARVDTYNAGSGTDPLTIAQFISDVFVADETARLVKQKQDADMAALKTLGQKYLDASPEVKQQVEQILAGS